MYRERGKPQMLHQSDFIQYPLILSWQSSVGASKAPIHRAGAVTPSDELRSLIPPFGKRRSGGAPRAFERNYPIKLLNESVFLRRSIQFPSMRRVKQFHGKFHSTTFFESVLMNLNWEFESAFSIDDVTDTCYPKQFTQRAD